MQCGSMLLLPPKQEGRYLRCGKPSDGHPLHAAVDPDGTQRRWLDSQAAKVARLTALRSEDPKGPQ